MLHAPYPLPCIPTGPVVLAFRESNRQSTSSTWPPWGQSCQAPRGSVSGRPRLYSGLLMVLRCPGSFLKATVILKGQRRTFQVMTTRWKVTMTRDLVRRRMAYQLRVKMTKMAMMMRGSRRLRTRRRTRIARWLRRLLRKIWTNRRAPALREPTGCSIPMTKRLTPA